MSDMPERIWGTKLPVGFAGVWELEQRYSDATEYVRADLVAAKDAELSAAKEQIARLREAACSLLEGTRVMSTHVGAVWVVPDEELRRMNVVLKDA